MSYLWASESKIGHVAEWLGRALQKLLRRFESVRDLIKALTLRVKAFLCFNRCCYYLNNEKQ